MRKCLRACLKLRQKEREHKGAAMAEILAVWKHFQFGGGPCVLSIQVLPCLWAVFRGDLADTYTFQNHFHDIQQMFVLVEQIC